jgi:hypothetical protein
MKKSSLILVGFIFILLLTSLTFSTVSDRIKNDILEKTKEKFYEKGINDIHAKVEGEGLTLSRNLILTGTVYSEKRKAYIASLLEDISAISSIKNQIVVTSPNYYKPTLDENGQVAGIEPFKPLFAEKVEKEPLKTTVVHVEEKREESSQQKREVESQEATDVSSQKLPTVTKPKELEVSQEVSEPEKPIEVVKAAKVSSQTLPKVTAPQQAKEVNSTPVEPQEVLDTAKAMNVSSSMLPQVVKPVDVSTIKVTAPMPSMVEVPKATEIETVYKEPQTLKKGEE